MEGPAPVAALAAGALSFLSPCVLPLVPGYLALMSGMSLGEIESANAPKRAAVVFNAVLFVAGFAIVFVSLGAAASRLGSLLTEHRIWLTRVAGVLVILMGIAVSGLLKAPALSAERRFHVSPAALGPFAAPVMGMAFAFGWTPCIGPILASVLALAATSDTLSSGVGLLGLYSLGLGVPFVLTAVAFGPMRSSWRWFAKHGRIIDLVSATVLVVFGLLMLTGNMGFLVDLVNRAATAIGLTNLG